MSSTIRHLLASLLLALPLAAAAGALDGAVLRDLDGKPAKLQPGQRTVLNFWATWCAPCRIEMPLLSREAVQLRGRGVRVVGIALDQPQQVRDFLRQAPVSYPILLADGDGIALMRRLGNSSGGLPFTVVLDEHGKPLRHILGLVDSRTLQQALR